MRFDLWRPESHDEALAAMQNVQNALHAASLGARLSNEVGPSIENAKAYNGNLIAHLRSMVGTPLMPGKSVDTYLFALYDEDLKPGPGSERSFGLFKPDLTMTMMLASPRLARLMLASILVKAPENLRENHYIFYKYIGCVCKMYGG
ncbi:hypothetical protein GH714_015317 [Hevea brasiliensis]|uniref:glucan endo-1,3-beta-D-glucosidase n=1 Tax=Hevea brasiliensis TaxID=3981 RepID=A0A6A6NHD6_HEVBR|nr:hypothetical protein GH714_015317 [Hevea brasiliensis]